MKNNNNLEKDTAKYRWIKAGLQILIIILLVTVTVIPGALRLLYRADAQVALGHAKIGAAGAPGNWKRKLWQERYFYGRFPGGRRHGKCQKRSSDAQQSTRRFLGTADVRRRLHGRQVPLL